MTGDVTAAEEFVTPQSARIKAQIAELRELGKQFPAPTLADVKPDWEWLYAEANRGALYHLFGQNVAVCEGKVVGAGADHLELRIRLSKQYQRHPERFVITYLGEVERPEIVDQD